MESLFKVVQLVFAKHWIALLFLSFSWIFVYGVFKIADVIVAKIFFELPFSLWIRSKRKKLGVTTVRATLMEKQLAVSLFEPDRIACQLSDLYASVDNTISRIKSGEYAISRMLRDETLKNAMTNIAESDWAVLETDLAFCRALSKDLHTMERGLLSFIGNPRTLHTESLHLLFYELKHSHFASSSHEDFELLNTLLYHLRRSIDSQKELAELRAIAADLKPPQKEIVNDATTEIEHKLAMTAGGSH